MKTFRVMAVWVLALAGASLRQQEAAWDLVIFGGRLIDGTGDRIYAADIAVHEGRIAEVGALQKEGRRTIDARGCWVTPGFIDMHSHSELSLLEDGRGLSALHQGVTLVVLGEHESAGPLLGKAERLRALHGGTARQEWRSLGDYFGLLEKKGIALNVASFVASGQVRGCVVGYENRAPTAAEMAEMKALVAQSMNEGALGLSSGLSYVPNSYASTGELIELAQVAASKGGIYSSHLRTSGADPLAGLAECLRIGREARIGIEINHINSTAKERIDEFAAAIEEARRSGLSVEANMYPYTAGMTFLRAFLPEWAQEGGTEAMLRRLANAGDRRRMAEEMRSGITFNARVPWDRRVLSSTNPTLDGKPLQQLATERNQSPEEALLDVVREERGDILVIVHDNSEENLRKALRFSWTNMGSDGAAVSVEDVASGKPHPRFFGTFPRLLYRYARTDKVVTPEVMVRKMTLQSAQRLNLKDRGRIAPGMVADLAVFHPETFVDTARFDNPRQYASGLRWLVVNGVPVVAEGKFANVFPGRVVRGPAYRK